MDTKSIKQANSQRALDAFNRCIKSGLYECIQNHMRHINNMDMTVLFNNVLNMNNHILCMKIINILYKIETKDMFLGMYLDKLIKLFLDSDIQKEHTIQSYTEVINACNMKVLNNNFKNTIKNITLEQFHNLSSVININDYFKEFTLYGSMDLITFINNTGYRYKESTIINFIIDILNNNDNINFDILKWIVDNYKDYVNKNLIYFINNIKNFSENNNSYIIIDYIFYLMKITNQDIFKILKKIIYNGNDILFCYMSIKYLSKIKDFNYFEYACLFSNPNSDINSHIIGLAYIRTELNVQKLDDIFFKLCKYKIFSSIKWFTTFLSGRYKMNSNNEPYVMETGSIKPIISPFYMDKKCALTQHIDKSDCCVCYENNDVMIQLNCHTSHTVCSVCFETAFNIKPSCPLCRANVNMSECIIIL